MLSMAAQAGDPVNIALVPVGDAGNAADPATGYGSVSYAYSVGEFDVTMGQYTAFLNAVASMDAFGLYSTSMATATPTYGILRTSTTAGYTYSLASSASANVPVNFVSWADAARFVNWLQNGEPAGLGEVADSTEAGSYALNGSTGSAALMAVTRSTTAAWVLPTNDEWYKAAYYQSGGTNAGYWVYPTQSNSPPSNALLPTGTNNANFAGLTGDADPHNLLTPAGFFAASPGPYGTYDQGGDVYQWLETPYAGPYREFRGGDFGSGYGPLESYEFAETLPAFSSRGLGFRVAYVPEPSGVVIVIALAVAGFICFLVTQWARRGIGAEANRSQPRLALYRHLAIEHLCQREMLSIVTCYTLDPSKPSPSFGPSALVWQVPGSNQDVPWQSSSGGNVSDAVINTVVSGPTAKSVDAAMSLFWSNLGMKATANNVA